MNVLNDRLRIDLAVVDVAALKDAGQKILWAPDRHLGDYIRREAHRYMRRHGITLRRKLDDPVMDPRAAGRAFHYVKHHQPALAAPLAHAFYDAYWAHGLDLSTADAIAAVPLPAGLAAATLQLEVETNRGQLPATVAPPRG